MTKEEIFSVIRKQIADVIYDINIESISPNGSLKEYGANSLDRVDVITGVLEKLNLRIPMIEFGKCQNIEDIIELLNKNLTKV